MKLPFSKPVWQPLRDPLAILHVGLAPRHVLEVRRIDQQTGEAIFERVVNRFPVDAGALHRHVRDRVRFQPVAQREQVG
jgi:hypothetical protein